MNIEFGNNFPLLLAFLMIMGFLLYKFVDFSNKDSRRFDSISQLPPEFLYAFLFAALVVTSLLALLQLIF